ncbi:putative replicative DNA helicase [Clostridium phage phiCTP1]|uniref:putative replicative DNA helicase n=1 Tax=Clostridium phage phiCTP1 TaxID=871584 RepID=UPI0001E07836|nr:putative replicative DNA helicase [Clostridium phage phiCTP1]ADL40341.1 putative replicative DNA helicase [Clostridium phage phiCTP1]
MHMKEMVELQVLNKLIKQGNLNLLAQNDINADYFVTYKDEFAFIREHYEKYGNVPNIETMVATFEDFENIDVTESDKYLVETLSEKYLYMRMLPVLNKVAELIATDSTKAIEYMLPQIQKLNELKNKGYNAGYDLVKNSLDRWNDYHARSEKHGMLGISSGLDDLDRITFGWLDGEDLITILGRTNEGKTWLLLYFLVAAWNQRKRVLLYSGEMGVNMIGYRFDTLAKHFSNLGLMTGDTKLGEGGSIEYNNWLTNLAKQDVPFIIVTPKDLGNKHLDVPTLHTLIDKYKPDIIGIDQYSLMADYRAKKGDPNRIKLAHISEDLFNTSEKYKKPILADAQAKRRQKKKKDEMDEDTPDTDEIQEADAIGQNSSRVISMKQVAAGLKMTVKKNRYGLNNKDLLYFWDIDKGDFKSLNGTPHNEDIKQEIQDKQGEDEFKNGTEVF